MASIKLAAAVSPTPRLSRP